MKGWVIVVNHPSDDSPIIVGITPDTLKKHPSTLSRFPCFENKKERLSEN
jgi:hypothetical protein